MKKCPYCAEQIQDEAIVCRFCGRKLRPVTNQITKKSRRLPLLLVIGALLVLIIVGFLFRNSFASLFATKPTLTPTFTSTFTPRPTLTLTATITPSPTEMSCSEQSKDFIVQIDEIIKTWSDVSTLASNTPRIQLPGVISQMQDLRRSVDELAPPTCAEKAHDQLLLYMDSFINAYLSFLSNEAEEIVAAYFQTSTTLLGYFVETYKAIKNPTINPTP